MELATVLALNPTFSCFLFLFFSFFVGILKYFPSPLSLCFFNSFESQFWDIYVLFTYAVSTPPPQPLLPGAAQIAQIRLRSSYGPTLGYIKTKLSMYSRVLKTK